LGLFTITEGFGNLGQDMSADMSSRLNKLPDSSWQSTVAGRCEMTQAASQANDQTTSSSLFFSF